MKDNTNNSVVDSIKNKVAKDLTLDALNEGRVETTKLRVAHAICLLSPIVVMLEDFDKTDEHVESEDNIDKDCHEIAHALNLLETGSEEFKWACDHFKWDIGCHMQIEDAIVNLGRALAFLRSDMYTNKVDPLFMVKEAVVILSMVLGNLERWFDETQDVSEV